MASPRPPPSKSQISPTPSRLENALCPTSSKGNFSTNKPSSLPHNVTITPPTSTTLRSYRRLITLLLPIAYPTSFYAASIPPSPYSVALLALWHDTPASAPIVVAGIQGRIEPTFPANTTNATSTNAETLYIQTLAVLAPYRGLGIASALLSSLVARALAEHPRIASLYAHVWEANVDALQWYVRRGFVAEAVVWGYYRRLKPDGARIVKKEIAAGSLSGEEPNDMKAEVEWGFGNMGGREKDQLQAGKDLKEYG